MATHEMEDPSESLKHKELFLKVPIQCACEGCKKKVRRILYKVEGVHKVDIDIKQQKVTVIGDVKPEALIKKLAKHGKEAKFWPENTDRNDKSTGKVKNREEQSNPETSEPAAVHGGGATVEKDVKPPAKVAPVEESAKKDGEVSGGGEAKATGGGAAVEKAKTEGKKPDTGSAVNHQKQAVEKKIADNVPTQNEKDVVKKKTKGQKGNNTTDGEPPSGAAPAHTGSPNNYSDPPPTNHIPPRHQGYQFHQPPHFTPPPPVYAVSYNTAHPSSSNTASYYTQPPPYSYAYSHLDPVAQHPSQPYPHPYPYPNPYQVPQAPPLDYGTHPRQPLDSFEMLSDENPNGCLIM